MTKATQGPQDNPELKETSDPRAILASLDPLAQKEEVAEEEGKVRGDLKENATLHRKLPSLHCLRQSPSIPEQCLTARFKVQCLRG